MKVAIQLPANPRSFKRCYESFKTNILDTLNPDIFIHTWDLKGKERPDVITDGSCQDYIDLYKPKEFIIEELNYNYQPLQTMVPHFTSRFKVNELRKRYQQKNNIKYDVVIFGRPDVKLMSPFKMEYAEQVKEEDIWIHHFRCGIPSDYFFYGSERWINVAADTFHELDKLHLYQPGSERLLWYKLQKEGFKYEQFKFFGSGEVECDGTAYPRPCKLFEIECIR